MDKNKQNTTPPDDMPRSAEERVRLIASRLRKPRALPGGQWLACSPLGDDERPSFRLRAGEDGHVLVFDHRPGVTFEQIQSALETNFGVPRAWLFPYDPLSRRRPSGGRVRIEAVYDYRDAQDELRYQVVRSKGKFFRQRQPNGRDGWLWNVRGVRPLPYHLPELIDGVRDGAVIWIAEGEKSADRLREIGFVATTNSGGAGKFQKEILPYFRGAKVALLADADRAGRAHVEDVARKLYPVALNVTVVELPGFEVAEKGGKDVVDWLAEEGHAAAALADLYRGTPFWEPAGDDPAGDDPAGDDPAEGEPSLAGPDEHPLTDIGNARRFVDEHGADWRYCHPWGAWLGWDGQRWRRDDAGLVIRRAMETAQALAEGVAAIDDHHKREAVAKWAIRSQQGPRLREMVRLARSLLPISPDALDRDNYLLNCQNGTLDLRTGELRPHRREDFITRLAPARYDPEALAPTWMAFLDRVLDGNKNLIDFLARAVGYSLTGDTSEQVLFMLHGTGANGKSTFLEAVRDVLGDYATNASFETFLQRERGGASEDVARLRGARLVSASEAEGGRRLSEVLVKQLTGSDTVTARFLYASSFEFRPAFKLFFAANHKPAITGSEHAIWRRIRLVPFTVRIPAAERDKRLAAKLRQERAGILAWAVRGCLDWQANGLGEPGAVSQATADYRDEMDVLAGFIEECCVEAAGASVSTGNLYLAYVKWAQGNGEFPISKRAFGMRMVERGHERGRTKSKRMYEGIGLRRDGVQRNMGDAR
jgi:putative DNA primase/helicase